MCVYERRERKEREYNNKDSDVGREEVKCIGESIVVLKKGLVF